MRRWLRRRWRRLPWQVRRVSGEAVLMAATVVVAGVFLATAAVIVGAIVPLVAR